ncbi:MAG: hypothetical protein GY941_03210 [Planctomycetes bacterium]|nr:hypothetical protein [Planctomycetota bacterium]
MNKYKKRLIILLIVQAAITAFHKFYESTYLHENPFHYSNWTYYLGMVFGIFVVGYAFFLSCPDCGVKQVFRGWSIFDLRWPEDKCYKCGGTIE